MTNGQATPANALAAEDAVAISGGSGLVGTALTKRLLDAGRPVVHLVRDSSVSRSVETILWDPTAGIQETDKLAGVGAIVHLAGRSIGAARWSKTEKALIRDSRVESTRVLAEQIAALQPPHLHTFVSASAIGIYGEQGDREVSEETPAAATTFLSEVAQQWEAAAEPVRGVLRVVHPRLGIVLSPQGGALAKMLPLFRSFLGGKLGNGQQIWSWISLDDCVAAIMWLLNHSDAQGAYNLTAPAPVSNLEFTQALAQAVSKPAVFPAPAFLLRLAMGEMAEELLLLSCRAVPARLLQEGFTFEHTRLEECLEAILPTRSE
jgi:hypothetical protein